ncbi:MAG: efflux RND transporter permease subunit, partial [Candidatus Eremiobacteraeota bacterium]|nr:efflux RND transporter permease subunit [Candidatus Eremiobacteraeota bacterium]
AASASVRQAIAGAHLPPGYRASIEGAYRAQQDSFSQFAIVIALAVALVFFVMLASFRSFRQPLVILAAVPLAPIGVALGLTVTRTPFNVSSFMGLLLLVGLVVKNGILLVDAANRRRAEGVEMTVALVEAGRERLRPILMTTFAAIGGLLPLAFGIGAGAAMERPLAIAVVGGLSTATLFTLVLIPVLYASLCKNESVAW